ncbi:MAG: hypothetical protein H6Q32_1328, partial [Bacteroidetes bacterium]|nr:hypothetical protein [Bacteroidota bacterium]
MYGLFQSISFHRAGPNLAEI